MWAGPARSALPGTPRGAAPVTVPVPVPAAAPLPVPAAALVTVVAVPVAEERGNALAHRDARAVQAALDRVDAEAEHLGDLACAQALDIPEHEHLAMHGSSASIAALAAPSSVRAADRGGRIDLGRPRRSLAGSGLLARGRTSIAAASCPEAGRSSTAESRSMRRQAATVRAWRGVS
jgi:hypothetical protein